MKTAEIIYQKLIDTGFATPSQLCSLHKPCLVIKGCQTPQYYPVLNFDQIKHCWKRQQHQPDTPSVDALTHKSGELYFVEIKGWKQFLNYQKVDNASIQKQADSYNLQGKLIESAVLCEEITGEANILTNIPSVFVLVTDINVMEQGLESIATSLNLLGSTSTQWETVCNDYLGKKLDSIKPIKTRYISCFDFDKLFS